jgi:hypothetical protein
VNGDGFADIAVGESWFGFGTPPAGAEGRVFVFTGSDRGVQQSRVTVLTSPDHQTSFGQSLTTTLGL